MVEVDPPRATIYEFPMAGSAKSTAAGGASDETGATPIEIEGVSSGRAREASRSFLAAARRDLTEEQASSPAGLRWLMHDVERLDQESTSLKAELAQANQQVDELKTAFNDKRVELEAAKSGAAVSVRNEVLTYLCISAGSAGLGACPGYLSLAGATTLAAVGVIVSALLLLGGLTLRVWK